MTSEQILRLVLSLPVDSPFFKAAFSSEPWVCPPSLHDRLQVGLFDPAFGWLLSRSYASAGIPLPAQDWPAEVRRAHRHQLNPHEADVNLVLALALHLPQSQAERDLMRALLICQGASFEMIADVFKYDVDVVKLFDTLFWNVRDRKHEPLYVAQLLNARQPAGAPPREPGEGNHGIDLIRLAFRSGDAKLVLAAAEVSPLAEEGANSQLLSDQIEQELLVQAAADGLSSRAFALVQKYLLPHVKPEQQQEVDPLEAMGMTMDDFLAYNREDIEREMRLRTGSGTQ